MSQESRQFTHELKVDYRSNLLYVSCSCAIWSVTCNGINKPYTEQFREAERQHAAHVLTIEGG